MIYVVLGATGQTGRATAEALTRSGKKVRVVVRDEGKGADWRERGTQIAVVADAADSEALARAFDGAEGAYVLIPPDYRSDDMFARAAAVAASIKEAARRTALPKIVALSSIGSHVPRGTGNILSTHILEEALGELGGRAGFLRAASFLDNWKGLLPLARQDGVLPSFYSPLERKIPQVASQDIGQACADVLLQEWNNSTSRVWELHGPEPYSPNDIADAFGKALGREVRAALVPPSQWPQTLAQMGNSPHAVETYSEMMRGFNDGTIVFEETGVTTLRGKTSPLQAVSSWV